MTQENALKLFKCLSDTSRLRIVQSLTQGEMYTELLAERLGLTPSTVSFHMKKLEEVGLAAPQVTYIMHALRKKGYPVNVNAITIEEAADEIARVKGKDRHAQRYNPRTIL